MAIQLDLRLENAAKKVEKDKKNPIQNEDEEETYIYDVKKPLESINQDGNGVFDIKKQTGINTSESVFDKGSVFKTS